jgi:Penicillin-insensitive murein endopeptidase
VNAADDEDGAAAPLVAALEEPDLAAPNGMPHDLGPGDARRRRGWRCRVREGHVRMMYEGPTGRGPPYPRRMLALPTGPPAPPPELPPDPPAVVVRWRDSAALGTPSAGRLRRGVRLPSEGSTFFTWDPLGHRSPSPGWRRNGTDGLVRIVLRVLDEFAADGKAAPRVGVGDLSRPRGGSFGPEWGGPGHVSHQNGLDVDVYFPRLDRRERPPKRIDQVDLLLSQELVDRFVEAGAEKIFVGPTTGLRGPPGVVEVLPHHDNHLHVRIPPRLA